MRHGKKLNHLGRKSAHRKAILANMASSLIKHKRIKTTVAKAKALRVFVEPLITKSKNDTTHSRRVVFSYLRDKEAIKELFGPVASAVASRPGGYTRILKIGNRAGDNAEMALIELVDFNELAPGKASPGGGSSRRRRRSKKKAGGDAKKAAPAAAVEAVEEVVADAPEAVEEVAAEAVETVEETTAAVGDTADDA
jgi:large subunit ribosomal protein L17